MVETFMLQQAAQLPGGLGSAAQTLAGNWQALLAGIVLIGAAIAIFLFLKKIVINSVLGIIAWAILIYVLKVELQFFPTLVISAIFGLAGIGVILVLKFLGIAI